MIRSYKCVVGVCLVGGCGSNTTRSLMNRHSPEEYPDFKLFVANTDASIQKRYFDDPDEPRQRMWTSASAFIPHQLGGEEVTRGLGAGANPDVGKAAALTDYSQEALRRFLEEVDVVIIVGGEGGGTATGAMPVIASLALEMGKKAVMAIAVMPEEDEGRNARATNGLRELQALVTTFTINNSYLEDYIALMPEDEQDNFTMHDAWQRVIDHSVVPMILILRAIAQEVGDVVNRDQADLVTLLRYGKHGFFGISRRGREATAEEHVSELTIGHFQNKAILRNGKIGFLWHHGPMGHKKAGAIRRLVKEEISAGNPMKLRDLEVFRGATHHVGDEESWIGLIVIADTDLPQEHTGVSAIEIREVREVSAPGLRPIAQAAEISKVVKAYGTINFTDAKTGERIDTKVDIELAHRFNPVWKRVIPMKKEDFPTVLALLDEVEKATGHRPAPPIWLPVEALASASSNAAAI